MVFAKVMVKKHLVCKRRNAAVHLRLSPIEKGFVSEEYNE